MRLIAILAAVFLAGCVSSCPRASHRLEFDDGVCSATAVGRHTLLSATHCFAGAHSLAVDGVPVQVLALIQDGNDHTLAIVSTTFTAIAELGHAPSVADPVHYWGEPGAMHDLYRKGYMSGDVVLDGHMIELFDVNGFFGDSGAALLDDQGRIVGVVSVLYQNTPFLKFMGAYPLTFTAKQWASIQ
jgi:hypothetical protein